MRQFLRVADPAHRNGPVSEGWQQRMPEAWTPTRLESEEV